MPENFENESRGIAAALIEELLKRGEKITFAESCTAGLLAGTFCSVSGASAVFDGALVSYANEVKNRLLGVPEEVLSTKGAVSPECAEQMAKGAARLFFADLALSVTGIAGPGGGTPQKPVGTVYLSVFYRGQARVELCHFEGSRDEVRRASVLTALRLAREALEAEDVSAQ